MDQHTTGQQRLDHSLNELRGKIKTIYPLLTNDGVINLVIADMISNPHLLIELEDMIKIHQLKS